MAIEKTRNTILTQALRMIGAIAEDEQPSAAQIQDGAIRLDWMVKRWQASGAHLWTEKEATLFLVAGQQNYQLGGTNTDNVTVTFRESTLSADEAAGQTVLSVTDTTGLLVNDFIGISLDDNTIHWTTVTVVSPVTISVALPSAAASGKAVVYYTTKIGKALRIPDARRRENSQDIEMEHLGRRDYLALPVKSTQGTPVQYYYRPDIDDGTIFIWPTASSAVNQRLLFTFYDTIDVFDTSASAADFPNEWVQAIVYNIAVDLAPDYGQPLPQTVLIKAEQMYKDALEWDDEDAPIYFAYSTGRGRI